jgi:uncharacterized Zn-finger protein
MTTATTQQQVSSYFKVRKDELPVCCPRPIDNTASLHPRVYLPFDKEGQAECPYCGTRYALA